MGDQEDCTHVFASMGEVIHVQVSMPFRFAREDFLSTLEERKRKELIFLMSVPMFSQLVPSVMFSVVPGIGVVFMHMCMMLLVDSVRLLLIKPVFLFGQEIQPFCHIQMEMFKHY